MPKQRHSPWDGSRGGRPWEDTIRSSVDFDLPEFGGCPLMEGALGLDVKSAVERRVLGMAVCFALAIEGLPENERTVLLAKMHDRGRSDRSIAEELGIDHKTVASRYRRALERLGNSPMGKAVQSSQCGE